jgi:site-specific DNA-methyltransferase (adenine-specific)
LAERGWIVRNKRVWAKPNPTPSSVRDRLSCTWEPLYLLVRSERYYFDLDAIREPHTTTRKPARQVPRAKYGGKRPAWAGPLAGANDGLTRAQADGRSGHPLGKNPGDVWTLATAGYRGAHFATFPLRLVERPILAAVPDRVCTICGANWKQNGAVFCADCTCRAPWRPGVVLDPFIGAGTVAIAAERHHRDWIGIEVNPEYAALAHQRIDAERVKRGSKEDRPMAA